MQETWLLLSEKMNSPRLTNSIWHSEKNLKRNIGQGPEENRTMEETLNLGWELLGRLPKEELDRVDTKILDKYYHPTIYDDTTTATSSPGSIANQN